MPRITADRIITIERDRWRKTVHTSTIGTGDRHRTGSDLTFPTSQRIATPRARADANYGREYARDAASARARCRSLMIDIALSVLLAGLR